MGKPLVSVVIPTHNRKNKLIRLIQSIQKSTYKNLEIIIVDDASTDGTYETIKEKFPKIKVLRNEKELWVSASRNIGLKNSNGDYIFLIDDDNVIAKNTIEDLEKTLASDVGIGVVGPVIYYYSDPEIIWCAGVTRNMYTSKTSIIGRNQIDKGQFDKTTKSEDFPNSFMIRSDILNESGLFDENNFPIHYEESDFCQRIRNVGYDVVLNHSAKVWHDIPFPKNAEDKQRFFHVYNEFRAYYAGRNRVLFHKKYSKVWQFLIFVLVFNPLITIYYLRIILSDSKKSFNERLKISRAYIKGAFL